MGNASISRPAPVAIIGKGQACEIRLTLEVQRGQQVLDCRAFDRFTAAGLYTPTARGISVPVGQLSELADGIARAVLAASERGLVGGDS
jgi:hypothetical protein